MAATPSLGHRVPRRGPGPRPRIRSTNNTCVASSCWPSGPFVASTVWYPAAASCSVARRLRRSRRRRWPHAPRSLPAGAAVPRWSSCRPRRPPRSCRYPSPLAPVVPVVAVAMSSEDELSSRARNRNNPSTTAAARSTILGRVRPGRRFFGRWSLGLHGGLLSPVPPRCGPRSGPGGAGAASGAAGGRPGGHTPGRRDRRAGRSTVGSSGSARGADAREYQRSSAPGASTSTSRSRGSPGRDRRMTLGQGWRGHPSNASTSVGGGRGRRYGRAAARVAQPAEQAPCKRQAAGSIPASGSEERPCVSAAGDLEARARLPPTR